MQFDRSGFGRVRVPALIQLVAALALAAVVHWGLSDSPARESSYGSTTLWAQVGTWSTLTAAVITVVSLLIPLPRLEHRAELVAMAPLPPLLLTGLSVVLSTAAAMDGFPHTVIGDVSMSSR